MVLNNVEADANVLVVSNKVAWISHRWFEGLLHTSPISSSLLCLCSWYALDVARLGVTHSKLSTTLHMVIQPLSHMQIPRYPLNSVAVYQSLPHHVLPFIV